MARPASPNPRVEIKIRLAPHTLAKLDLICYDVFTEKLSYGVRNDHIEAALIDYFAKHFPERTAL